MQLQRQLLVTALCLFHFGCAIDSRPAETQPAAPLDATPVVDLSPGRSAEFLKPYIGKRVMMRGFWCGLGKESGYIRPKNRGLEIVYVKAVREQGLEKQNHTQAPEGTPVEVTGELRQYNPPPVPATDPATVTVQRPPMHFYFDIEQTVVTFGK